MDDAEHKDPSHHPVLSDCTHQSSIDASMSALSQALIMVVSQSNFSLHHQCRNYYCMQTRATPLVLVCVI